MPDVRDKIGRYRLGGIAKSGDGTIYEVIGFITTPAVVLREVKTEAFRYEVIGCRNEESDLTVYMTEAEAEEKASGPRLVMREEPGA